MADLSIQGEVVVNSEKAESAFDRVGDKASQMANEVATSANKAGQAVDKIGDGAGASAEKFTRAESRISASIKRATTELELLGKTASQRLEFNIADKGLDASKFEPALKKLREIEAQAMQAQRAATGSLDKMGVSAAQTAAALRGVPAQFTDIVTSLQGGQAPLTVFLQQGGQLRDMFGGAGNAARALGGYVAGLVNPFTMAAAAIASIAVAYKQGSAEADGYRMALVMTGNAAGTTAAQMQQMAGRISSVVGTQGAAADALAQMASSGRVASQSLEYFSEVAIKFERTTGTAISETVKRFAELGASPVDASRKLNEETNYLTASIYEQIKALKDQGREADAAALAQNTYADALNNRSAQITQNLGAIEGAWKAIKDAAKSGWDAMLNVGRADSLGTQIDNLRAKIAQAKGQDKNRPFSMPWDTSLADLEKQLSFLTEQERVIRRGAEAQAQRTQAEKEAIAATDALQKTQASGLTNQQKMNKALEEYARHIEKLKATNPASVLLSPDAIARGEKAIRDQFSDKGKGSAGIKAVNKDLADQQRIYAELAGVSSTYYKELAAAQEQRAKGNVSEAQYVAYVNELIQKQPFAVALAKEEAKAQQTLAKANLDAAASREKYITSLATGLDKIQADITAQIEATARMGLSKEAIAELDAAKLEMLATDLELQAIKAMDRNLDQQTYDALKKQAAAYRELGIAKKGGAAKEAALDLEKANADAAKKAQEDWGRAADGINQSLTDALLRGFESGKGFAKNLRDTLKNMFNTLVLRPIISAVMTPVSMAANGVVQGGMNAVGLGGGGNLMGMASNASSLNTLWGAGSQAIFGGTAGASAASLGYANLVGAVGGDAIGALAAGNGMWAGVAVEAGATAGAAAGAAAIEAGAVAGGAAAGGAGAAGAGLTGALSAIPVWGWAAMAALALVGSGAFDSRGANHSGGVYSTKDTDRNAAAAGLGLSGDALGDFTGRANTAIDAQLGTTVGALSNAYQSLTKYAGDSAKQIDIVAGFAVNGKHKDEDAYGYFKLLDKLTGETLASYSKRDGGLGSDPAKAWEQYVTDMGTALVDEIRKADIPGWMDGILASFGEEVTSEELTLALQQIQAVDVAFGLLGVNMELAGRSADGFSGNIVNAMGGLEKFQTAISGYYENYYSGTERLNAGAGELAKGFDELGVAMPRSRQELRGMITAQLEAGESGQELAASLLNASVNFDNFADSLMSMSGLTTDSIKGIFENILEQANSAQEAEQMATDAFGVMIMDSMQNAMLTGLSDMVMSSLVAPLMESMLAGAVTSSTALASGGATAAVAMAQGGAYAGAANAGGGAAAADSMAQGGASAGASMASGGAAAGGVVGSFLDHAKVYLGNFTAVMSDPEVQAAMAELGKTFGSTAGSLYSFSGGGGGGAKSFNGGGGGGGGAGAGGAASEADKLREAIEALGNTMADEVKRLRGLMVDDSPAARDVLLAQFTTQTAMARAGDQGAMKQLPELSKALESATAASAISSVELARMRGWLAGSLEDTLRALNLDLPQFAIGTNYVPRTMAAVIHEGEAIVPKAFNPWAGGAPSGGGGGDNQALIAEVRALREENSQQASQIAALNLRMARVLESWEASGMPEARADNWSPA